MKQLAWIDGRVVEASSLRTDEPFVMQRIHTLAGRAYNLERHLAVLNRDAETLFGFATLCTAMDAEDIISRLLAGSHAPLIFSCPVDMRLTCSGELIFVLHKPTFGHGAYLRSVRYAVEPLAHALPKTVAQTSATIADDAMSDREVRMYGGDRALWLDAEHNLVSRPWLPVFVVYRNKVYTPAEYDSVEYTVAREAIHAARCELSVATISREALYNVDEIFFVDVMGITAASNIGHHRLLYMTASRVAERMMPKSENSEQ